MRILALSDIEDFRWKHGKGEADMLLSCGDVPDQVIIEAAEAYGCSAVFAVKGNHDANTPFPEPIADLHLRVREYAGLRLGGLNGSWKYKPKGHFLYDQRVVEGFLAQFPPVDVFLSHNSPRGIHDREDEVHYGFAGLGAYLLRARPRILIHGHQHLDRESDLEGTRIVGVHGRKLVDL